MNQGGTKEGSGQRGGASIHHLPVRLSDGVYFRYWAFLLVARVPLFIREGGENVSGNGSLSKCLLSGVSAPPRRRGSDADVTGSCRRLRSER